MVGCKFQFLSKLDELLLNVQSLSDMRFIALLLCLISLTARSQVVNDDAAKALKLELGQEYGSQTDNCTVQPDCVDESLTGKCVDYHNDQWFYFNSGNHNHLYINIFDQQCRDLRGVQLIVFEGSLCNTATYQILTCISLETQNDIHTQLINLKKNQDYWIIIDGYLEDYCRFKIKVGDEPIGIAQNQEVELLTETAQKDELIEIRWKVPDSLAAELQIFQLLRKKTGEFKHRWHDQVYVQRNTFGDLKKDYMYHDTIRKPGEYHYLLTAVNTSNEIIPVEEFVFELNEEKPAAVNFLPGPFVLNLDYPAQTAVEIKIYDQQDELLREEKFNYRPELHQRYKINQFEFLANKIFKVKALIKAEGYPDRWVELQFAKLN